MEGLLQWFAENRRTLPWRKEPRDPYHVWISEIMLQQTQVATVVDYFNRWMGKFPDIPALSQVSLEEVLKAWEGLGYYSRARNLYRAAHILIKTQGGKLPRTSKALQALPGIGPYTAAAIASLAFGEDVIAVDGNIKRVTARLFVVEEEMTREIVLHFLKPLFRPGKAGQLNEALMELGALCCTPRDPSCRDCPFLNSCGAYQGNAVVKYPVPRAKKKVPHVKKEGIVLLDGSRVFLKKRSEGEMLGGLWGIPLVDAGKIREMFSRDGIRLDAVRHAYTHFRITVIPVVIDLKQTGGIDSLGGGKFASPDEIALLPLSTLDHKILKGVRNCSVRQEKYCRSASV